MRGIYSILAFLHPQIVFPNGVINYTKDIHEIKSDGTDLTDGLEVDDIGKLEEFNFMYEKDEKQKWRHQKEESNGY